VTVFGGKQVKVHFNADSVFIYDIPLERPYKNEYNYCKGMAIYKKGCPIMCFKWFFSDAGIKKADKYIKRLNKKVWYKHVIN
jgi:hypothetical protein